LLMVAKRKAVAKTPLKLKAEAAGTKKAPKLTNAGQNFISSGLCIATSARGKACCHEVGAPGVPYCKEHMRTGDPSLKVVTHPKAGKILIAARDLPKGYRIALWGHAKRRKDVSDKGMEWAFDITGGWFLDPTKCPGSLVQFCPCAGPNEAAALLVIPNTASRGGKYGSWPFITREKLPKNWQVTMQYGSNSKESDVFFEERGIKRVDVGTKAYPALRRKDAPLTA